MAVPTGGGKAVALAQLGETGGKYDFAGALAVDGSNVYWTDSLGSVVSSVPLGGGPVSTVASDGGGSCPSGIAIDASNLYWTDFCLGTVMAASLSTDQVSTLASGLAEPDRLTLDGANLFVADVLGIAELAPGGGTTLLSKHKDVVALAAGSGLVFSTLKSEQRSTPEVGQSGTQVEISASEPGAASITVDASYVYWVDDKAGTLRRADLDGSNAVTLSSGLTKPVTVVNDATYLYVAENIEKGRVLRFAK